MSDFFKKKKITCMCSIKKKELKYENTYKNFYKNTDEDSVDILILLEYMENIHRYDFMKSLCSIYFKGLTFAVLPALGCSPDGNYKGKDIINNYVDCKKNNINKIIKKLKPKVIVPFGRALYTITETSKLNSKHFYIPIDSDKIKKVKSYNIDDCFLYSSEYNCNVYPVPPLFNWLRDKINDKAVKDVYESKFFKEQFKRVKEDAIERRQRKPILNFELVDEPNELVWNFIDNKDLKALAIDTESSSLNYFSGELYTIQFSPDRFNSYFCYFKDIDKEILEKLFDRKDITFIMQNAQHDLKFLIVNGIQNARCDFDTMLASHQLNENSPNGLKLLTWIYTIYGGYDKEIKEYLKLYKIKDFTKIPEHMLLEYACHDSIITFILYEYFMDRFEKEDSFLKDNYFDYIIPAIEMIVDVEMTGVQLDMNYFYEYSDNLKQKARAIETKIFKMAGKKFNISSGKQLTEVLYSIPGFTPLIEEKTQKPMRTKNGDLILDKHALKRYSEEKNLPFAESIIEYNHLVKEIALLGFSYDKKIEEITKKVLFTNDDDNDDEENGKGFLPSIYKNRLHGGYKLHGTKPGRMAGGGGLDSSVNWQNQPTEEDFRKMFLPSLGYVFGRADYDAMEMCIVSQLSGSGPLEEVILSGKDPHCYLAVNLAELQGMQTTYEEVFEKSKVNPEEEFVKLRDEAKIFNFQLIYGATKYGLSNTFNITLDMAEEFLKVYAKTYPEVSAYIKKYRKHAKDFGWVRTLLGRKRRLPELTYIGKDTEYNTNPSFNYTKSLNAAINAPDQGTSGQTTLIAMTNIRKEFKKQNMKSRIIINVHDEIVFELWIPEIEKAEKIIKFNMEQPYYKNKGNNKIQLTAELEVGEIWKYGKSLKYWEEHPEEWKQCLESIEKRNKNNFKINNE